MAVRLFFTGNYKERINSPIITTGNELIKQQIADFSKHLDLEELYSYIFEVCESTEKMLEQLSYHWIMHIEACLRIKNKIYS